MPDQTPKPAPMVSGEIATVETLGALRELTADLPDDTRISVVVRMAADPDHFHPEQADRLEVDGPAVVVPSDLHAGDDANELARKALPTGGKVGEPVNTSAAQLPRRCVHCGEQVERKDDGAWWHIEGYAGYVRCRLVATPPVVMA